TLTSWAMARSGWEMPLAKLNRLALVKIRFPDRRVLSMSFCGCVPFFMSYVFDKQAKMSRFYINLRRMLGTRKSKIDFPLQTPSGGLAGDAPTLQHSMMARPETPDRQARSDPQHDHSFGD